MLFTGTSDNLIDAKSRLAIPAKHRGQVEGERAWYCVPWPGRGLRLYPERVFTALAEIGPASLVPGDEQARLETAFFGYAERLEMDEQGRITLPRRHIELSRLGAEVVVIGARNRLEVRDRASWSAGEMERFSDLPLLVEQLERQRRANGPGPAPGSVGG